MEWKSLFGLSRKRYTAGDLEAGVFLELEYYLSLKDGALLRILAYTKPSPWPVSPLAMISFSRAFICPKLTFLIAIPLP